jgi:hypothetical protein
MGQCQVQLLQCQYRLAYDHGVKLPLAYGLLCDDWKGHPAAHQEEARRVFGFVPPFTWVATACGSKLCLTKEHLVIRQPLNLGYPTGLCIYCGLEATQRDHLIPEPWSGPAIRPHVLTVPACRECNNSINDSLTFSITKRREIAHEHIYRRHGKWLRCKYFTNEELEEMGPNLRSTVHEGHIMRAITEARVSWPHDQFYDLHAAQAVGIENPYVIGMLDDPFATKEQP